MPKKRIKTLFEHDFIGNNYFWRAYDRQEID